jgi:hypothetical protein
MLANIRLTSSMTKLQVRQAYKQVTEKTYIEDIFIGLKQAEIRQELKDKIDTLLNTYNQYMFYTTFGLDKIYDKIISVLAEPKLTIKILTDGTTDNSYKNKVLTLQSTVQTNIIIHELIHAYNDIKLGGFSYDKDEAMATIIGEFFGGYLMNQFISWEQLLDDPNVTENKLITKWNQLWYVTTIDTAPLPTKIFDIDVLYSYWIWEGSGSRERKANIADLINIKNYYGIYFSQKAILEYSRLNIPQGYNIPIGSPPFGYTYK